MQYISAQGIIDLLKERNIDEAIGQIKISLNGY
jgi:hypothetical protein